MTPLLAAAKGKQIPLGLELYSVRDDLAKDLDGTVKAVAQMGYQGVEFYGPYYEWTPAKAKEVRALLDQLKIRCYSTHNGPESFTPDGIAKAIELNSILGSKIVVLASAGEVNGLDGWKKVAETLNQAAVKFKAAGLRAGYHNHDAEFRPIDGVKPLEVIAKNTTKDVVLQLDVGTCVEAGSDPVAWIKANPGRIASIHCKEWSREPGVGYKAIFGAGSAPWKEIFQAAEKSGGVEYYLIEQEGSDQPPLDTVKACLAAFRKVHG